MEIETGGILTGKVTGITKFGAFVALAPGKSGLVHISEIANTYVADVNEFLTVGQDVTVKVIGTDGGKINLSMKAALPPPRRERPAAEPRPARPVETREEPTFEDKLRRFMQDSDTKMSGVRGYADKKVTRRRDK
jgi:S1 RNA binding domain protein